MVHGIDYTSVSPWARRDTGLGLVSVVYILYRCCFRGLSVQYTCLVRSLSPSNVRCVQS